jgi:hypothetical protein
LFQYGFQTSIILVTMFCHLYRTFWCESILEIK